MKAPPNYLLINILLLLISTIGFSQENEKSTIIGNLTTDDEGMNLIADNVGNTYVAGRSETKGLIVKQNTLHQVLWSKQLSFTSDPSHEVSVDFLDLLADTLFGCGRIHLGNSTNGLGIGSFYFKMNAQTGNLYWAKFETNGQNSLSAMRYANGKYFLVGNEYGTNKRGRVVAVSSQNGNLIWQTPCINYSILANSTNHETIFTGVTEILNGKMYISGNTRSHDAALTDVVKRPFLLGITESGTFFLHRYFDFPGVIDFPYYVGSTIKLDADNNLILGTFHNFNSNVNIYSPIIKCDTLGNILFSKSYPIQTNSINLITHMTETPSSYVFYGYINSLVHGMYALKITKSGILEKCVLITKPNTVYNPIPYSSYWKVFGNSKYINGKHYFPANEKTLSVLQIDINKIILDENLEYTEDCSLISEIFPSTNNIATTSQPMFPLMGNNPLVFSNGGLVEDLNLNIPCSNLSINLNQNQICNEVEIIANVSGFVDPSFYWSNGASSDLDTIMVNNSDTLILHVLDTKCCELTDTIVPNIAPSSFNINLQNDTTVCIQNGSSFQVTPFVSGANGPVTYQWNNNTTSSTLNISQSGVYWVDVSDNCTTLRDSIFIVVNFLPAIGNTSDVAVCEGNFPLTLNPTISNGTSVLWDNGITSDSRSVNSPGSYTLSATNNCGTVNATITVNQIDLPEVELILSIDTCIQNGNSIVLTPLITGANSILWSDGSSGSQLTVSNSGTYSVYVSNVCGVDSATCSASINHYPELNLPSYLDTCFEIGVGFSYTAYGSAGTYNWSSGSQSATEWISQEGLYIVTLTNECGITTDSMVVSRLDIPDLLFPEDSISSCSVNLAKDRLNIETNYDLEILTPYQQIVNDGMTETGWYTLHAFNGCWHKYDSIYVDLQQELFYLPNSFTPNDDLVNDRFEYKGEYVVIRSISIYNRWGQEIYSETGSFKGWDGTFAGENCPDGVYPVQIVYENCFGMPTIFNGHVTLFR